MRRRSNHSKSSASSGADLTAADAQPVKSKGSAAAVKAMTVKPGVKRHAAKAAVAQRQRESVEPAANVEPIDVPQAVAKAAVTPDPVHAAGTGLNAVAVGVTATVPPTEILEGFVGLADGFKEAASVNPAMWASAHGGHALT